MSGRRSIDGGRGSFPRSRHSFFPVLPTERTREEYEKAKSRLECGIGRLGEGGQFPFQSNLAERLSGLLW